MSVPSPPSIAPTSKEIRHTHTHLTYSRHRLINVANETLKIAEIGAYRNSKGDVIDLRTDLERAVEHSVHYPHNFDHVEALRRFNDGEDPSETTEKRHSLNAQTSTGAVPKPPRFRRTSFLVVSANWLEAASELIQASSSLAGATDVRVGVLNSASGTTPGGRFLKGTVSQEDCLCRASLLYSCISQPKFQANDRFYGKNRTWKYGTSSCVIFSPDVPVIREDTVEGLLLDEYQKISFVTIPAPNAFTTSAISGNEYNCPTENKKKSKGMRSSLLDISSQVNLASLLESPSPPTDAEIFERKYKALRSSVSDRIHRALSAFVFGRCTDLVLPAFGCGVHGNDPTMVAEVFHELLQNDFKGRFRTVVFAIPPCRKQNYQAFSDFFQKMEEKNARK